MSRSISEACLDCNDEDRLQAPEALEPLLRRITIWIRAKPELPRRVEVLALDDVCVTASLRYIAFETRLVVEGTEESHSLLIVQLKLWERDIFEADLLRER